MFSSYEKNYMRSIGLDIDFNHITIDDLANIEDVIGERLETHGFDKDYKPTYDGIICEKIIDRLLK